MLSFVYYTCWVILIIDCILLILLILAQESKAQGLGGLGGGMDLSFAGHTQRTAKRMTAIFAVVFGVTLFAILIIGPKIGSTGGGGTLPDVPLSVAPSEAPPMPQPSAPGLSVLPANGVTPPPPTVPAQNTPPVVPSQTPPPTPGM